VAGNAPADLAVQQLGDRDLASVGSVGLVEDVLGGDLDAFAEVLANGEQIDGRRGNDNLCKSENVSRKGLMGIVRV
jgi:hypothetical protein